MTWAARSPINSAHFLIIMASKLIEMAEGLRRSHYINEEDCWYSCPKAKSSWGNGSACCNDEFKGECRCGADDHNAKVDALIAALSLIPLDIATNAV